MDDAPSSPSTAQHSVAVFVTPPYACNYLPNLQARSQVVAQGHVADGNMYGTLLDNGFRRSGMVVYRPWCDACQACTPIRLPVADFSPSRSQRRCLQRNKHLQVRVRPLVFEAEHYALYRAYQRTRHAGGSMDHDSEEEYRDFLLASSIDSRLVEFRDNGVLKMVALVDHVPDALSAVYTFYADEPQASFGTYAVLWQIARAQQLGLTHLYLGYWIAQSRKMQYKTRFRPFEMLQQGRWQRFGDAPQAGL